MATHKSPYSDTLLRCWRRLGIPPEAISDRDLPVFAEAEHLQVAETDSSGREHLLVPAAARAWTAMRTAAHAAGVGIYIVSAHRSIARQIEIIERKLAAGQTPAQIFTVSAPPGCSEHHTGRAVDIGTDNCAALELEFEATPAFGWLQANAERFGFTLTYPQGNRWGYSYEPWHWCYREG